MATLQDYLGITKLRDAWPKWKANVIAINNQIINHVAGTADKHAAEDITYSGDFAGKAEVKAALDQAKTEIDTIVVNASVDPEVALARDSTVKGETFDTLDARLEESEQDLVTYKVDNATNLNQFPIVIPEVDDTARLQRAIDHAFLYKKSVFIPGGDYSISSIILKDDTVLIGEGITKTVFTYVGGANAVMFSSTSLYDKEVYLKNIGLKCNDVNIGVTGLKVTKSWGGGINLENVKVEGFHIGVDFDSVFSSCIDNCDFRSCNIGLKMIGTSAFTNVNSIRSTNLLSNVIGLVLSNVYVTTFDHCTVEANDYGVVIYGTNQSVTFDHCWLESNTNGLFIPCKIGADLIPLNTDFFDISSSTIVFNKCFYTRNDQPLFDPRVTITTERKNLALNKIFYYNNSESVIYKYSNQLTANRARFRILWPDSLITQEILTLTPTPVNLNENTVDSLTLTHASSGRIYINGVSVVLGRTYAVKLKYRVKVNTEPFHTIIIYPKVLETGTSAPLGNGAIYVSYPYEHFESAVTLFKPVASGSGALNLYFTGTIGDNVELGECMFVDVTDLEGYGYNVEWLNKNLVYTHKGIIGTTKESKLDSNGDGVADIPFDITANRPTELGVSQTGFCFYDTTLSKPIWWTGIDWKDSAGVAV